MIELTLPWPPSLNTYYENATRRRKGSSATWTGRMISEEGKRYRYSVLYAVRQAKFPIQTGRLTIEVDAHEPNRSRVRDLDNLFKCMLDALTHAKAIKDDGFFDRIVIERADPVDGGKLIVRISRFEPPAPRGLFG